MKFSSLLLSFTEIMEILNDSDVPFGDTFFYLEKDGKFYTTSKIECRYSDKIDKHAVIIHLDDD